MSTASNIINKHAKQFIGMDSKPFFNHISLPVIIRLLLFTLISCRYNSLTALALDLSDKLEKDSNHEQTSTKEHLNDADPSATHEVAKKEVIDEPNNKEEPLVTPKEPVKCIDDGYCLNGGTCILSESGQMTCICQEGFYGARCQTRNICKTLIADSLTGDQICAKISRDCFMNDKFFRCSCLDDEYFVFKTNLTPEVSSQLIQQMEKSKYTPSVDFKKLLDSINEEVNNPIHEDLPSYYAECHKIDKCLGVRCRQMSELCQDGECICNRNSGYIKDPDDGLCKLLDPCKLPTEDGSPICGQAQCIATYDSELYRCICPVGYKPLKIGEHTSTTQCALLKDTICEVPILNKCQHICRVDSSSNSYKCSCLPGYKAGSRMGVDDHLCFFNEQIDDESDYNQSQERANGANRAKSKTSYIYKSYLVERQPKADRLMDNKITYDFLANNPTGGARLEPEEPESDDESLKEAKSYELHIKREPRASQPADHNERQAGEGDNSAHLNKMSPQDRCNMFCEDNKICILESGSTDSYRCQCDRQGYVSVGDRCLDWCAAAEFSHTLLSLLGSVCWSGACKPTGTKPSAYDYSRVSDSEVAKLERESSWRPTFECDCSSSPLLFQDPATKLCKLDFQEVLKPCLPGNVGHTDCVVHKNAYCAVLHKIHPLFIADLQKERPAELTLNGIKSANNEQVGGGGGAKSKSKTAEKSYACVCSPEKKFLVDKPRNKERCVDECDLLNIECGRFNRMCRAATIAPNDFSTWSLVRRESGADPGYRMNFKRTGCECLPGFNVGPSESVDFTIDDNNPAGGNQTSSDIYPQDIKLVYDLENSEDPEQLRTKYMNINSRCLLDYDVVEFHASFKAPANFDPNWVKIRNLAAVSHQPTNEANLQQQQIKKGVAEQTKDKQAQSSHEQATLSANNADSSREVIGRSLCDTTGGKCVLMVPDFMRSAISELHKNIVLVSQCSFLPQLGIEAYEECVKYRYWIVQKMRNHFVDWRRVLTKQLSETFDSMDGNIRLRVNKCEATLKKVSTSTSSPAKNGAVAASKSQAVAGQRADKGLQLKALDLTDQNALVDADLDCELTLHSAGDDSSPRYSRKVLLEKQLQKFIFVKPASQFGEDYYLMAPNMLIRRQSFDQLAEHRKMFNPCKSDYAYCDKQTKCEMVDTVNFTCTCEYGYTPIGSRDIYYADSRKEVCEDINECLFDVCKELVNVSTCINEIGDYRCQCNRHYTGDNKRYCTHVCNTIPCKHGKCRLVDDHHAFCECDDGYKETDCSVQDPNVALRKANMIICGSIFTSVLLLAITIAISLNSQLKKTKKKLKRLEAANDAAHLFEFPHQQPFRPRMCSKVSSSS